MSGEWFSPRHLTLGTHKKNRDEEKGFRATLAAL
jgi:hypothetical protein